jgi:hypothetical protein
VDENITISSAGFEAGADDETYDTLANAIVTALGDVAAQAFRSGVDEPQQLKSLATAISRCSEDILLAYVGEYDPEPMLQELRDDPRRQHLTPDALNKLDRDLESTQQIERLLLSGKRLPDLLDYAGSLGLSVPDDASDGTHLLLSRHPTTHTD